MWITVHNYYLFVQEALGGDGVLSQRGRGGVRARSRRCVGVDASPVAVRLLLDARLSAAAVARGTLARTSHATFLTLPAHTRTLLGCS